jgi:uncharacterized peroxidase-related enzyme
MTMEKFIVPSRGEVSANNQIIFDRFQKALGFVPNLYATMAYSDTGLENYVSFQNAKTSLSKREKEIVNILASQQNGCRYCQSAHTVIGKMNGFADDEILEIRNGSASFDDKLNALAHLTYEILTLKGNVTQKTLDRFFDAGYTHGNVVDVVLAVAEITVTNYLHNITQIPIDFPLAPELAIS